MTCITTGGTRGMSGLRRVGIHSSILVRPLYRTGQTRGHLWTQTSGYPLLHPGLTPVQDWSDQGASLDSDEWVSTPPSWSNGLHHYWLDQGHVWTWMSGYPLLHPGRTPVQDWSDQGACLDSDKWVSTPPSWSDGLHHYWSDQGHVWTWMSGYPLLHPGLMACTTTRWTRGMSGLG